MEAGAAQPGGKARSVAGALAAALGIGLLAFVGLRVKETLADRSALKAQLAQESQGGPKRGAAVVVHATARRFRPVIPVTGTLAPVQEAEIGFKTGGRLQVVKVKVGDQIKAGEALAALDVSEASAQSMATKAAVRAAAVGLEMAKDSERRTAALFEQKAVSDFEALAAKNRTALAVAQFEQARAQAQLAAVGVSNGALAAPFGGLVTKTPNGVGKIVAPGEPLFHLEDTSVLKLTATLSEVDARLVEVGAEITIDDASGARAEGVPRGKITAVLGSLDPQTRRVPVIAEIPNTQTPALLAGAFVRATVTSSREIDVLELPAGALRPGSQDEVVVLTNGKAHLARVVFSTAPDGTLLVRGGITAADAVVKSPSSEVREGQELGSAEEAAPKLATP